MLTKNDKQFIRDVVKEEVEAGVKEALTVEWTIEKVRDEKTGQPLAVKEIKTENVFIPAVFVQMMPYLEGALRGVQKDISKNNNKINSMVTKVQAVGNILVQAEESFRMLAKVSDHLKMIDLNNLPKKLNVIDVEEKK